MNIYIHIPFCHSKCAYCAFLSHCDLDKEDEYVAALCREIEHYTFNTDNLVNTLYFGGGTPSLLSPRNVRRIIETFKRRTSFTDNFEITLESNPEDITDKKLVAWKESGITRVSIGVQSLNDTTRVSVNRALTAAAVLERVALTKKHFENVGVDLISGLPHETKTSLLGAINQLTRMGINHISLYDLETDNSSAIGMRPEKFPLPCDDKATEMLTSAWELLVRLGYEQYEISNFARNQQYCRHNLDFWEGKDYLGFGLGATSRVGNTVSTNARTFEKYLTGGPLAAKVTLSTSEINRLNLLAAMRLDKPFKTELQTYNPCEIIPDELLVAGLVSPGYKLTPAGRLVYNQVVNRLL